MKTAAVATAATRTITPQIMPIRAPFEIIFIGSFVGCKIESNLFELVVENGKETLYLSGDVLDFHSFAPFSVSKETSLDSSISFDASVSRNS